MGRFKSRMAAAALLCLGLAVWWGLGRHAAGRLPHVEGAGSGAAGASQPAGPAVPASPPALSPAIAPAAGPAPAASADNALAALSPRARRMQADWCGYGVNEAEAEARQRLELSREQLEQTDGM